MSPRTFAAVVGIVLIFIGIAVLAQGANVANPQGYSTLDCGSALSPNTKKLIHDADVDQLSDAMLGLPADAEPMAGVRSCEDTLSTRHMFGWPLSGLGVLLLAGAALVRTKDSSPPEWASCWLTPSRATTRPIEPQQEEPDLDDTTATEKSSGDWVGPSARKMNRNRIRPRRMPRSKPNEVDRGQVDHRGS